MFNATEFTYAGIYSGLYGLKIASMSSSVVENTSHATPTISSAKPAKGGKFFLQDAKYTSAPTYSFSIVSETPIPEPIQREVMNWLNLRKEYKILKIHQAEFEEYDYRCIFHITQTIYHAGQCVGYTLQATFDSIYQYGHPTKKVVTGTGVSQDVSISNLSDCVDEYIYPTVEFNTNDGTISIINKTDSATREFSFTGLAPNTTYVVDNELKTIEGGTNVLSKFSKKWLRLLAGKNQLSIRVNGTVKIICPHYAKIKF